MFAPRFFGARYFAPRYYPPSGGVALIIFVPVARFDEIYTTVITGSDSSSC